MPVLVHSIHYGDQMIGPSNLRISLDRRESNADIDFVSHAHTDHVAAVRSSNGVLASNQTIQLIEKSHNVTVRKSTGGQNLRLIEAGHMLGSKQLCTYDEKSGNSVTYTGDFQISKSKTSKPIEVVDTDILIVDSTYADPFMNFSDKNEVESALQDWTLSKLRSGIVIFSAYALGKAQELIAIMNGAGIKPIVSRKISVAAGVYVKNGINLDYCSAYESDAEYNELVRGDFVGITDSRNLSAFKSTLEHAHSKSVYTAVATGFAKVFRFNTDAQFPLSDHADFAQCKEYIDATGAKKVLTYGQNMRSLANNLQKEGYDSMPFEGTSLALQSKQLNI